MMEKHIHDLEKVSEDQKQEFYRCKACGYGEYRPKPEPERRKLADRFRRDKPLPPYQEMVSQEATVKRPQPLQNEEHVIMKQCLESAEMLQMAYEWLTPETMKDVAITMFIQKMRRRL